MLTITELKKNVGIHITTNHNDKMNGLSSLSTSPLCNELCQKRKENKDMVCGHCYSDAMNRRYKGLRECLIKNTEILTSRILEDSEIPFLISETGLFRFEAFGDLVNEIQVVNYFKMAALNPHMHCALWTKNPWIIKSAIEKYGISKPGNLVIIGSSYFLNKPMEKFYRQYDFIDYIFTVYDKKYIKTNNVKINCGGNSCKDCRKCYENKHESYFINEMLK